jgi:hypothetical protein
MVSLLVRSAARPEAAHPTDLEGEMAKMVRDLLDDASARGVHAW